MSDSPSREHIRPTHPARCTLRPTTSGSGPGSGSRLAMPPTAPLRQRGGTGALSATGSRAPHFGAAKGASGKSGTPRLRAACVVQSPLRRLFVAKFCRSSRPPSSERVVQIGGTSITPNQYHEAARVALCACFVTLVRECSLTCDAAWLRSVRVGVRRIFFSFATHRAPFAVSTLACAPSLLMRVRTLPRACQTDDDDQVAVNRNECGRVHGWVDTVRLLLFSDPTIAVQLVGDDRLMASKSGSQPAPREASPDTYSRATMELCRSATPDLGVLGSK